MLSEQNVVKQVADGGSILVIAGTLLGYMPQIAALCAVLWYIYQAYEVVKKKLAARKQKKRRASDK